MLRFLFPYSVHAVSEDGHRWVIHTQAHRWLVARGQVINELAPDVRIVTIRRRAPVWLLWLRARG